MLKTSGIFVERNNSIRLQVAGNPTTGYQWVFDEEMTNGAFTVTKDYVQNDAPPMMVGVGGMYYFTIEAGPTEAHGTISLGYKRSWEAEPN